VAQWYWFDRTTVSHFFVLLYSIGHGNLYKLHLKLMSSYLCISLLYTLSLIRLIQLESGYILLTYVIGVLEDLGVGAVDRVLFRIYYSSAKVDGL
jgi:hypothetical protein